MLVLLPYNMFEFYLDSCLLNLGVQLVFYMYVAIRLTGDDRMGDHALGTWLYRGVATAKLVIVN